MPPLRRLANRIPPGSLLGGRLAGPVPAELLRKAFGWFVVLMGASVLAQQLPAELRANPLLWAAAVVAAATPVTVLIWPGRRARVTRPAAPRG
ncbi:hypothetical protein [Micromonospora sp. NPDC051296]|uniref:hypothetical protein n=1 Tax=Micromonospora sp. NPDC051296 TaxID=3155046 RepID=UPI0034315A02